MDKTFNLEDKTIEPQIIDKLEEIVDFLTNYGGMCVFIFHYCTFVFGEYLWFKRIVGDFLERVKEYTGDIMSVAMVYKWWNARINTDIFIKTRDDENIPILDGDEEVRRYGRMGVLGLYDKGIEIKTNSGKMIIKPGDTVRTDILY
jgi:hypothetical protein